MKNKSGWGSPPEVSVYLAAGEWARDSRDWPHLPLTRIAREGRCLGHEGTRMIRRTKGALLILLGALGMVLSALGVIGVWRASKDVAIVVDDPLVLLSDTLNAVAHSLDVASATLDGAALAMDGLHTTTVDVSGTLSSTRTTLDEMATLTGDDLPQSIGGLAGGPGGAGGNSNRDRPAPAWGTSRVAWR